MDMLTLYLPLYLQWLSGAFNEVTSDNREGELLFRGVQKRQKRSSEDKNKKV